MIMGNGTYAVVLDVLPGAVPGPLRVGVVLRAQPDSVGHFLTGYALVHPVESLARPPVRPRGRSVGDQAPSLFVIQARFAARVLQERQEVTQVRHARLHSS